MVRKTFKRHRDFHPEIKRAQNVKPTMKKIF
jgi:hypothetical protein